MDLKLLYTNYLLPFVMFIVNGLFMWVAVRYPEAFDLLEEAGVTPVFVLVLINALIGFLQTKLNPLWGKSYSWNVPAVDHEGEDPTLLADE